MPLFQVLVTSTSGGLAFGAPGGAFGSAPSMAYVSWPQRVPWFGPLELELGGSGLVIPAGAFGFGLEAGPSGSLTSSPS